MVKEKDILWSDKEIRGLMIEGIISELLASRHQSLLGALHEEASNMITSISHGRFRQILAAKISNPAMSLMTMVEINTRKEDKMSGYTYNTDCPRCGGIMVCYSDHKLHDMVSGECLDCGFEYHTDEGQMSLEDVNELRKDNDLEPLTQLAEPTKEWLSSPYA